MVNCYIVAFYIIGRALVESKFSMSVFSLWTMGAMITISPCLQTCVNIICTMNTSFEISQKLDRIKGHMRNFGYNLDTTKKNKEDIFFQILFLSLFLYCAICMILVLYPFQDEHIFRRILIYLLTGPCVLYDTTYMTSQAKILIQLKRYSNFLNLRIGLENFRTKSRFKQYEIKTIANAYKSITATMETLSDQSSYFLLLLAVRSVLSTAPFLSLYTADKLKAVFVSTEESSASWFDLNSILDFSFLFHQFAYILGCSWFFASIQDEVSEPSCSKVLKL